MKRFVSVIISFMMIFSTAIFPVGAENNDTRATKSKAIVIIPGIAGSKLMNTENQTVWFYLSKDRVKQLRCTETGSSINVITPETGDTGGVIDTYQDLYSKLKSAYKNTYDVFLFSYDWRMSCASAASSLATKLQPYSEVILIGHSMGGLVASKYLAASSANRAKVDKFISLGTPYTGSAKAVYAMETGKFVDLDIDTILDIVKSLVCNFTSVYELLPTNRYNGSYIKNGSTNLSGHTNHWNFLKAAARGWSRKSDGSIKPMFNSALSFHSSLLVNGTHIANSSLVDTYKIYGTNKDTISKVLYTSSGTVSGVEYANSGDGTVLRDSAINNSTLGSDHIIGFNCGHMTMPDTNSVINEIKSIINGTAKSTSVLTDKVEQQQVNEKGWIIGEDNKRINIMVYNNGKADLRTSDGYNIISEGDSLYYLSDNEEKVYVGSVWYLGNNSYQYSLFDGDYIVEQNSSKKSNVKIEYLDSGYYIKSMMYSDVLSPTFTVSNSNGKNIVCTNESGQKISPTKLLSDTELNVLNNA